MATFAQTEMAIAELVRMRDHEELLLRPAFQRLNVWSEAARSFLIDTIMRRWPMPKFFVREIVSSKTEQRALEVVDGQQRLKAILDFYDGKLRLRRAHAEFGGATFGTLPVPAQRLFLQYRLSVEILRDASDPDVWDLFQRLNTYTIVLNKQEKLNARHFGYFKQTAYSLASEEASLRAWRELGLFSDAQIARMSEVEFTSDIMVALLLGVSDITKIKAAYADYDEKFSERSRVSAEFRQALAFTTEELALGVSTTKFRNRAWAYSLLVAVADAQVGIPGGHGEHPLVPGEMIVDRMTAMHEVMRRREWPPRLQKLQTALSRGTSHAPARRIRHEHFYLMLTLSEQSWRRRWRQLIIENKRDQD